MELQRPGVAPDLERDVRPEPPVVVERRPVGEPLFFLAEAQPDGTYRVTLTEEGLSTFETALAIARDLGGQTRISTRSTVADIMERTAIREELSEVLRQEDGSMLRSLRILLLRRMLWGSEEPSHASKIIGHIGKLLVIGTLLVWTLLQVWIAISDIAAIPGILAGIPSDILNLHPTSAFSDVGQRISDAGTHVLYAALGACFTYVASKLIKPFARIYRHDQLIPGERLLFGGLAAFLRYTYRRRHASGRA
jgi:hypothetical protein